jgi:MoaD family protein, archaeal
MGKITITFYGTLAKITGEKTTTTEANTLRVAIAALTEKYGDPLKKRLYDSKGNLARFVNIYVNGKDVRFIGGIDAELKDGDGVSFIPAVGGG